MDIIRAILFLHILGAVGLGVYFIMPLFIKLLKEDSSNILKKGVYQANRIAQMLSIIQLLTGGYLMSKGNYSVLWMTLVILIFCCLIGGSGILGKRLKNYTTTDLPGMFNLSVIQFGLLMGLLWLMSYSSIV